MTAKRIKKHLGKLISGCQKAYQDTSNIGEIILNLLEIIAISNFHKKPGMILLNLIDFSKAFDSISHECIYESLTFFITITTLQLFQLLQHNNITTITNITTIQ